MRIFPANAPLLRQRKQTSASVWTARGAAYYFCFRGHYSESDVQQLAALSPVTTTWRMVMASSWRCTARRTAKPAAAVSVLRRLLPFDDLPPPPFWTLPFRISHPSTHILYSLGMGAAYDFRRRAILPLIAERNRLSRVQCTATISAEDR